MSASTTDRAIARTDDLHRLLMSTFEISAEEIDGVLAGSTSVEGDDWASARLRPLSESVAMPSEGPDAPSGRRFELLIPEAEKYLSRVVETDQRAYELSIQDLLLRLEAKQFILLDRISDLEVSAGLNDVPVEQAASDLAEAEFRLGEDSSRWRGLNAIKQWMSDESQKPAQALAVDLCSLSIRNVWDGGFLSQYSKFQYPNGRDAGGLGAESYKLQTMPQIGYYGYLLAVQDDQRDSARAQLKAATKREAFAKADRDDFRPARRRVARHVMMDKVRALLDDAGRLSYKKRLAALTERQRIDLGNAHCRMKAIRLGAKEVYRLDLSELPSVNDVEGCINWLHEVEAKVSQGSKLDQMITVRVKVSAGEFVAGRCRFVLPEERVSTSLLPRFRGMAIYSETDTSEPIDVDAQLPEGFVLIPYRGLVPRTKVSRPEILGVPACWNDQVVGVWQLSLRGLDRPPCNLEVDIFLAIRSSMQ